MGGNVECEIDKGKCKMEFIRTLTFCIVNFALNILYPMSEL